MNQISILNYFSYIGVEQQKQLSHIFVMIISWLPSFGSLTILYLTLITPYKMWGVVKKIMKIRCSELIYSEEEKLFKINVCRFGLYKIQKDLKTDLKLVSLKGYHVIYTTCTFWSNQSKKSSKSNCLLRLNCTFVLLL